MINRTYCNISCDQYFCKQELVAFCKKYNKYIRRNRRGEPFIGIKGCENTVDDKFKTIAEGGVTYDK